MKEVSLATDTMEVFTCSSRNVQSSPSRQIDEHDSGVEIRSAVGNAKIASVLYTPGRRTEWYRLIHNSCDGAIRNFCLPDSGNIVQNEQSASRNNTRSTDSGRRSGSRSGNAASAINLGDRGSIFVAAAFGTIDCVSTSAAMVFSCSAPILVLRQE